VRNQIASIIVTTSLFMAVPVSAADFVLVSEGQPKAEIVLAESQASGPVFFAVQELQRYVKAMSGASLPVVKTATDRPAIVVGRTGRPLLSPSIRSRPRIPSLKTITCWTSRTNASFFKAELRERPCSPRTTCSNGSGVVGAYPETIPFRNGPPSRFRLSRWTPPRPSSTA
jgi:hypothetical protein